MSASRRGYNSQWRLNVFAKPIALPCLFWAVFAAHIQLLCLINKTTLSALAAVYLSSNTYREILSWTLYLSHANYHEHKRTLPKVRQTHKWSDFIVLDIICPRTFTSIYQLLQAFLLTPLLINIEGAVICNVFMVFPICQILNYLRLKIQ